MVKVFPFRAVTYANLTDVSDVIAPPYDVLDKNAKAALTKRSDQNVVSIDLPHLPAKELGPPEAYAGAAQLLADWLADGTLSRHDEPVMFAYRQTFEFNGATVRRTGMGCVVETLPFGARDGGGVLPHEETFSGPKADRLALMKATRTQTSPIFGLHQDADSQAVDVLRKITAGDASWRAETDDGLLHEVWVVQDAPTIRAYTDALADEDVFVADGHHRYNTALNYLAGLGDVSDDHPARRCMMILASMSDAGLVIGPTHRVLGGMSSYSWEAFCDRASETFEIRAVGGGIRAIEGALEAGIGDAENLIGMYDFKTQSAAIGTPREDDPLKGSHSERAEAWRRLDVAVIQEAIVGGICQPHFNDGNEVTWAFPHSIDEVLDIGAGMQRGSGGGGGFEPQLALLVRPTPLEAVREVSRAGELMPQKSTFFFPKLATGLFLHPLE